MYQENDYNTIFFVHSPYNIYLEKTLVSPCFEAYFFLEKGGSNPSITEYHFRPSNALQQAHLSNYTFPQQTRKQTREVLFCPYFLA